MEIQQKISYDNNQRFVGKTIRVIIDEVFEDEENGGIKRCIGRTEGDAPEVDNQVHFSYDERIGEDYFVDVLIDEADAYDLIGEAVFS